MKGVKANRTYERMRFFMYRNKVLRLTLSAVFLALALVLPFLTGQLAQLGSMLLPMITALAALLRYSIRGGNLVRLETELGYVEKYLSLQKARFGERLTYRIHVDPALIALNVPKLGVLSLVENAIVHGMSDWLEPVTIQLEGTVEGDQALLTVSDDGAGIAPDKLATLRNALESANVMFTQGVGLMNLSSRLRLLYNGSAKIILNSGGEPRRTTVSLWIPLEVVGNV